MEADQKKNAQGEMSLLVFVVVAKRLEGDIDGGKPGVLQNMMIRVLQEGSIVHLCLIGKWRLEAKLDWPRLI